MIEVDDIHHDAFLFAGFHHLMPENAASRQCDRAMHIAMTTACPPADTAAAPLHRALPYLALTGSILSFCFGTSFAKHLFPLIGAPATVAYRVGFSALLLLAVVRPWRLPITRADLLATMRYGAVLALMNFCFYMALRTIPLGLAIAIEFLGPLTVSLMHSRRPSHFLMVGLAAAGLALLLPLHQNAHGLDPVGVLFGLGSGLGWGLYIIFGKRVGHLPGGQAVALGMATGALIVVPMGLHDAGPAMFTLMLAAMGLGTAVLSSAIPYSLEIVALRHIPANRIGVLMSLEPAVGALAGGMLLGEHLAPMQWLAIALVVSASAGSVLAGGRHD
jgi:inner membrane transporter RhtA